MCKLSFFLMFLLFFFIKAIMGIPYEFYIDTSLNKDINQLLVVKEYRYCSSINNPCTSMCEVINYMNNQLLPQNITIDINIYILNYLDFNGCYFNFSNVFNINFYGINNSATVNLNNFSEINLTNTQFILFDNLNIKHVLLKHLNKISFFNCNIPNNIYLTEIKEINFLNSNLTASTFVVVDIINFENCIISFLDTFGFYLFNTLNFKNVEIKQLNPNYQHTVLHISFGKKINFIQCTSTVQIIINSISQGVDINYLNSFNSIVIISSTLTLRNSVMTKDCLKLIGISADIFNNLFINCDDTAVVIDNVNPIIGKIVDLKDNEFRDNFGLNGGAIFIKSFSLPNFLYLNSYLNIKNCKFINNYALKNGGAIYSDDSYFKIKIDNCEFIDNSAFIMQEENDNSETGNGGALYVSTKNKLIDNWFHLSGSNFIGNKALRGGALFIDTFFTDIDNFNLIENNTAICAGGGVFVASTFTNLNFTNINFINIKNNKAKYYGNDIASFASQFFVEFDVNHKKLNNSEELIVYSGLEFGVNLKLFDLFGQKITKIIEPVELLNWSNEMFHLVQVYSTPFGYYRFYTLQNSNFSFNGTIYFQTLAFKFRYLLAGTAVTIVTTCPEEMDRIVNDNFVTCEKKTFGISTIILITTICAISFFIIGIGLGILIIYSCWKIVKKLKKLEKKERAEREIVKKIVDKQFLFGNVTTPLLRNDKMYNPFLIPIEELTIERKVGEGSCGTVFCGKWGSNIVAIKSLKQRDDEDNEDFEREVVLLSNLRHPNIVTFYGISITDLLKYIIIEYLPKGSLKQLIYYSKIGKEKLTLKRKLNILIDIAQGMNYLHTLKPNIIIHRDLKPENVLLDSNGVCKVCDFGLGKIIGTATQTMTTNVGTLFYISPEMLNGGNNCISTKIDIYSFGIIMWELFFEENIYNSSMKINYFRKSEFIADVTSSFSILSLVVKGLRPCIPFETKEEQLIWLNEFVIPFEKKEITMTGEESVVEERIVNVVDSYLKLMKQCWCENPNDRPSFTNILNCLKSMK